MRQNTNRKKHFQREKLLTCTKPASRTGTHPPGVCEDCDLFRYWTIQDHELIRADWDRRYLLFDEFTALDYAYKVHVIGLSVKLPVGKNVQRIIGKIDQIRQRRFRKS